MKKNFLSTSPLATQKFGEKLAGKILKRKEKDRAAVLGLIGELGGGKTTFLQGFSRGLGVKEKILSPTFIILRKSEIQNPKQSYKYFYHIDCYRIQKSKELLDLGFKEIISDPRNIVAVEWADRVRKIMPKDTIWIEFRFINQKQRKLIFKQCAF
jgi:tRNA threonylcarbamoyladenosine biosynthesis protein TsaE